MVVNPPNFGTPLAIFQPHWRAYAIILGIFLAGLGGGVWIFLGGSRGEGLVIIGIASVLLGIYGAAMLRLDLGRQVMLFEEGLIDHHGSTVTVIRWADVIGLRFTKSRWLSSGLCISLRDGGEHALAVALDPLSPAESGTEVPAARMAELIEGAMYFVAQNLLPFLLQRYDAGYDIDFGQLTVNQQGLRIGSTVLLWDAVEDIDIHGDDLLIMCKGVRGIWQRLRYYDLRNPFLLRNVLDHAQGERFSLQINPGGNAAVRTWLARRRTISALSMYTVLALPFVLIIGWFVWDYHDWSTNPDRHNRAGYACLTRNAPAKALPNFERALAIDPTHAPARCGRGAALGRLNQPAAARTDLERCLSSTDDDGLQAFAERELRLLGASETE